jgi:hypothetical protein
MRASLFAEQFAFWTRRAVLAFGLAGAVALVWVHDIQVIRNAKPVPAASRPKVDGVAWSDVVFTSSKQLERWLHARGENYTQWAVAHQSAAAVLRRNAAAHQRRHSR